MSLRTRFTTLESDAIDQKFGGEISAVRAQKPGSRCHEIDHPPMPDHPPFAITAQSSTSYCVNRVRCVSRQFMQNYGDSSAEVYD